MKRHYGSAVPIALAEPVFTVFRSVPAGLQVTTPVWAEKADDRHLIIELCLSGITPGLYSGRTVRSMDLTRQARIRDLIVSGLDASEAEQMSLQEAKESEPDWRAEINRRLSIEDRADMIRRWSYQLVEQQIILRQRAEEAFPSGIPDLEIPEERLEVGHVRLDRWTAVRLSRHPDGLAGAVREEVRHVLQSPHAKCGYEDAVLRRSTEEGMRITRLDTVDTGPLLSVQRNVIEDDGVLLTFDGRTVSIYGLKGGVSEADIPVAGDRLGATIDTGDALLDDRIVETVRTAGPGEGGADITIEIETDAVTVSDMMD